MTGPLRISPETAIKLSKQLNVPLEHLMHMPRHLLLQKMAELAAKEAGAAQAGDAGPDAPRDDSQDGGKPGKDGQA